MTRVIVYHGGYGCDTGCCGHIVQLDTGESKFNWDHPSDYSGISTRAFVQNLVILEFGAQHVQDIDWDNVVVSND